MWLWSSELYTLILASTYVNKVFMVEKQDTYSPFKFRFVSFSFSRKKAKPSSRWPPTPSPHFPLFCCPSGSSRSLAYPVSNARASRTCANPQLLMVNPYYTYYAEEVACCVLRSDTFPFYRIRAKRQEGRKKSFSCKKPVGNVLNSNCVLFHYVSGLFLVAWMNLKTLHCKLIIPGCTTVAFERFK